MSETLLLHREEVLGAPLERIFLGWDGAALRAAAIVLADHYARGGELRMGAATVVLPGARAGRRLKMLLVEEAERRGVRLAPPRVITLGTLPELFYRPEQPFASEALGRRLWARALRALPAESLARLVAIAPAEDDLRGWMRLGRTVEALHHEVSGAGKRFAEVLACCAEGLIFDDTERWAVLAEAQRTFERELARLAFTDRGLARIDALAAGALAPDSELWLLGVVEMPGISRQMLERLSPAAERVRVLVHAPQSEAGAFDAVGCLRPEAWGTRPLPLGDEQIAIRGRPAEQADEVVRALAVLGGRYTAEEVVIAAPDTELLPYLEQQLAEAGVPVRAAEGGAVERSPVARLLAAFADYLDGGRYEACAALVRHPDLGRWLHRMAGDDPAVRALAEPDGWLEPLDAYFTECLPAHLNGTLPNIRARGAEVVGALRRALAHERLLGRMRGDRPLAAWMPELLELLLEVYGHEALNRAEPAERRLLDACQCLRNAAAELHALPPELDERCDAATAIRLLLDEVEGAVLAPDADHAAVELLGWLELRLDDAPVAMVTGFNEPFLPESVNAHAFLPNALRERLGLVCNARRYARDAYELTALLHSRERVQVIAGRSTATGDPLRPSRLMFAVEGAALARRVRRFYDDDAAPALAPPPAPAAAAVPAGFRLPPEPVLSAPEPIRTLAVTAFRQLLADPYGFALERILRLAPLDDRAREMDGLRFGNLAHAVLESFAHSAEARSSEEARIRARLDATLDAAVHARFGAHALPAVRIQTEQLRARLHGFARWHADWIAQGWQVVGAECRTPEGGVAFQVDGEVVYLTGRIDRIDHHPQSGAWALFDYKTGARGESPEQTHRAGRGDNERWIDLQLPLYRHLLPEVLDDAGRQPFAQAAAGGEIRLGYVALPQELERAGAHLAEWTPAELEDADECAREVVRAVLRNRFEYDPARAAAYRKTPFAPVLGIGYLESAATEESDE